MAEIPDLYEYGSEEYDAIYRLWVSCGRAESVALYNYIWLPVVDGDQDTPVRFVKDQDRKKFSRYGYDPAIAPDTAYVFQKEDLN